MTKLPDASVLIVNDRQDALLSLGELLVPLGVQIVTTISAEEALRRALSEPFAVAIVDIHMPELDGFSLVRQLRASPMARELPVIFVSAVDSTAVIREKVYALGGADFIPLPAPPAELRSKVAVFVSLFRKSKSLEQHATAIAQSADYALQQQQERLRLFMETASDYALIFTDTDGRICEWTAGAENVLGFRDDEAVGQPCAIIFTPEDRAAGVPEAELKETMRHGEAKDERWHVRKNGERFFAIGRMIALRSDTGLQGFVKILRDATAAKQAENQLQEALDRFESLAESMAQMAWMADSTGARFWFNRRWYDYTGTTLEQMRDWGFTSVYALEDREGIIDQIRSKFRAHEPWESQWRIRGRDGKYRWFLTQVAPVHGATGDVRWFGTNTDIDSQVRLQEQMKASEQKFREIFETANEGIWMLNADMQIEMVNERMADLLGYEMTEILGRLKTDFVYPEDVGYVRSLFEQRRRGELASVEVRFRRKDGRPIWTLLSARPLVRQGRFAGALDMFTDISARKDAAKQFEDELKAQVAERTRALNEKSHQLESFAYTIAHDLRSPLRAISGYAEFTLEDHRPQLPADAVTNLEKIQASAARLDTLIHDLLSYTRVSQVEFVEGDISLQATLQWAMEQLREEVLRKSATIQLPEELPCVRGERSILDQIFLNLLSNALKFVPPGTPPRVEISVEPRGALVCVKVRDNGVGVPLEYQERIFRVFERLEGAQRFEGTGVGLAIVARAAERLGGRAGVDSTPGSGSTFWVELRKGTVCTNEAPS